MDECQEDIEDCPYLLEYLPSGVLFEIFKHLEWMDLCSLSQTCTRFNQLCEKATLWVPMRTLDFTKVAVPLPEKILKILRRCHTAENLILGDVVIENIPTANRLSDEDDEMLIDDDDEATVSANDQFMLDVLKQCNTKLKSLNLTMHKISDNTVEAICAKCGHLRSFAVHDNDYISKSAIVDLLSYATTLRELEIDNCESMYFPEIQTSIEGNSLHLTKLSLNSLIIGDENLVNMMVQNCKQLQVLDLTNSARFFQFSNNGPMLRGSAYDTLKKLILKNCYDLKIIQLTHAPNLCSVDISRCVSLTSVELACPELEELETTDCESLRVLKLTPCSLRRVSLRGLYSLETLEIKSDELTEVDLSNCTRLSTEMLLSGLPSHIKVLNLNGCKNVSPVDLNEKIFTQFSELESLHFGGQTWSTAEVKSQRLKSLHIGGVKVVSCIPLNIPTLTYLKMFECRDITEQEMVDGMLYGKEVRRPTGIEKLIQDNEVLEAFKYDRGIPNLESLILHKMVGLQGDYISSSFSKFKCLSVVEIISSPSLAHICIDNCPILRRFTVESCNRLSMCNFHRAPSLQVLVVKWCSMVKQFQAILPALLTLDVTGTNFSSFSLVSESLQTLNINGVCTQRDHTLSIQCPQLQHFSLNKCDVLSDEVLATILSKMNQLNSITLSACSNLSSLTIPGGADMCSFTGHRRLCKVTLQEPIRIEHLVLNNLAKFDPVLRYNLVKQCEETLKILEVRAIPGETKVSLDLRNLHSLTLDQGIHLSHLEILCPKLKYLKIQGCPRLISLTMHIDKLSQLQIFHSTPLLALKFMKLYISHVNHLARVLTHYCPNLETLELHSCSISLDQAQSLGQAIPDLLCIKLYDCLHDLQQPIVYTSAMELGRKTDKSLQIHCLKPPEEMSEG